MRMLTKTRMPVKRSQKMLPKKMMEMSMGSESVQVVCVHWKPIHYRVQALTESVPALCCAKQSGIWSWFLLVSFPLFPTWQIW